MIRPSHALLLLVLAAATFSACDGGEEGPSLPPVAGKAPPEIPTPEAVDDAPASGPAKQAVATTGRFVGTVLPSESAELGPKMSGTLAFIAVDEGDVVKKGQLLFRVSPGTMKLQVDSAQAALEGALLARDEAARELERQKALAAKGTVSNVVVERAQANYDATNNAAQRAEVGVSMSKRALGDTTVSSPINGVVSRKLKNVGETVTMMPPTVVLVIQDQSALELRVRVPEAQLKTIRPGGQVVAHFTAIDVVRPATISRIMPTIDPVTRTIEIVGEVDNSDDLLRPGMYVEVEIGPEASGGAAAPAAGKEAAG
ncbi:MAG: efflux RND transporter periplasmic adaptor subunit [Myxococcales bacterium]|nr:efflux RND transporter periplasmic adaptor subunit [Myxococcales bacterium]MCB9569916.1 efflux RND transporter periplasmic adaptor subunit [Myxococcales bacterium]MCB9704069.1 efflux RND transporter periplasmic adaptor subunit [Myxococcales bacterium]